MKDSPWRMTDEKLSPGVHPHRVGSSSLNFFTAPFMLSPLGERSQDTWRN